MAKKETAVSPTTDRAPPRRRRKGHMQGMVIHGNLELNLMPECIEYGRHRYGQRQLTHTTTPG